MSKVLPAAQICAEALRAIGAFPVTESAPDGEQLRTAMTWLDLIMAQLAGTTRVFALVPATLEIAIVNGTQQYDLTTELAADLPIDRTQFPVDAWLEDGDGNRSPLTIVTRNKFEDVSKTSETGVPCWIYIDRLPSSPQLYIFPTPDSTDTTEYVIKLVVQKYAPNVAPAGVTGTQPSGSIAHGFSVAWQRHLIAQLAHDLGAGPIVKLPETSLNRFMGMAAQAKAQIEAFENREHDTEPPIVEPWGAY